MIVSITINNNESIIYTVPENKRAYVFLDIFSPNASNIIIKINDLIYYQAPSVGSWSAKLFLTAGDQIKVGTNGTVNVFLHGLLL